MIPGKCKINNLIEEHISVKMKMSIFLLETIKANKYVHNRKITIASQSSYEFLKCFQSTHIFTRALIH